MENALYLKDCYLKKFNAKVVSIKDGKYILLDKSAFYPVGGGQPHDEGKIVCKDSEYKIVFVGKFNGEISHEVDHEGLKVGDEVVCFIDWERRYRLMRMHTAAHILDSVIHKESGALFTGNQLGLDKSRLDFSLEDFDRDRMAKYIEDANELVKKGIEVNISFMPKEEAQKFSMLKDWDYSDMKEDELRIIEIDGIDKQPCGGCHIKNTSEIGKIGLVGLENKGKGRKRLYFTLLD
ncbi:alanyl-tRNA editing protein [Candidatus Woesearchaeota archaeon]|nr:alanyl-tRNA editing protein [Candidatus Woesearchaeota archaeon]